MVRELNLPQAPIGAAMGPNGLIYVTVKDGIFVLDPAGGEIDIVEKIDVAGIAEGHNPCWLANGNLAVLPLFANNQNDPLFGGIREIDIETGQVVNVIAPSIQSPTGVAANPFRLTVEIEGELAEQQEPDWREIAEGATLVYGPASGAFALVLDTGNAGIIGPMFNTGIVSLNGFDVPVDDDERGLHGAQVPRTGHGEPLASLAAEVEGSAGVNGYFFPEEVSGTVHIASPAGVFHGSFEGEAEEDEEDED